MRSHSTTNWGIRCKELGYLLFGNVKDDLGRRFKYGTYPDNMAGGHNYFDSLRELVIWVERTEEIRMMQDNPQKWEHIKDIKYRLKAKLPLPVI